jgi:hypothetical protein
MTLFPRPEAKLPPLTVVALLAGRAAPLVVAVPYNPSSVAFSAPPTSRHHVHVASNSAAIDMDGRRTVDDLATTARRMVDIGIH